MLAIDEKSKGTINPELDFTRVWAAIQLPDFNMNAMIASQQKNIDAINIANKAFVEGWHGLAKKQSELWQVAVGETNIMMQEVAAAKEPTEKIFMQAAFAQTAVENSYSNACEAQEITTSMANKAVNIYSTRWTECLDEVADYAVKPHPTTATGR
jgi:phasin family protein